MKRAVLIIGLLLAAVARASAQAPPVLTATVRVSFAASPDHNATVDGTATLANYFIDAITMNRATPGGPLTAGAIAVSVSLGKPTPGANNVIDVPVPTLYSSLPNGIYTATVKAVGPGGTSAASPASDPFLRIGSPATGGKPVIVGP